MTASEKKPKRASIVIQDQGPTWYDLYQDMYKEVQKTNDKLTQIYDLIAPIIKRNMEYEKTDPVLIDESTGTCPACEATNVDLGETNGGHAIYKCISCELVWVNDPDAR